MNGWKRRIIIIEGWNENGNGQMEYRERGEREGQTERKKGKKQMLRNQKKKKTTTRMTKNKYRDYKNKGKGCWMEKIEEKQNRNQEEILIIDRGQQEKIKQMEITNWNNKKREKGQQEEIAKTNRKE